MDAVPITIDKQNNKVKISMIYPGKEKSDYWTRSISSFSGRLAAVSKRILLAISASPSIWWIAAIFIAERPLEETVS